MSKSKVQKPQVADDEEMDPTQYFENRVKTLGALKSAGINPYPHKFHVSMSIPEYIEKYKGLPNGEQLEDVEVSLAGRIMGKRSSSAGLLFYDLHGDAAKVQVFASKSVTKLDEAEFSRLHSGVKRGDVVGVIGYPGMVKELTGGYKVKYHANGLESDLIEIDFTPPFRSLDVGNAGRIDMIEELEKMANLSIPKDLSSDEANKYLADACMKFDIRCRPPLTTARLLDKLVGHFLEETCVNPTFIINHPEIMSPLAKWHRAKPGLTERFELFINKHELCNAYTELNDPVVQRQRFADQLKDRQSGDDEAMALDETFCMALEYGLPPTGGWGLGIDRLTMILTDSQNIKEVLLFPAMKPQDEPPAKVTTAVDSESLISSLAIR
ncbi:hypothetical protein C3L33_03846, partial [Rhododendron williamsianum]